MKKLITGLLLGCIFTTAVFIPILHFHGNDKRELGKNIGFLNGQIELLNFLDDCTQKAHSQNLSRDWHEQYHVKDREIVIYKDGETLTFLID